ncbi:WD repeat-containing protein 91 [Hetaerina americana]|uniref:WD repeat-containing protein 91 n=1 Tax=Hetaerina americana TaxID=62018 RepID=UPI003A7F1544
MSHVQYLDELIREYLLYRGFSGTLKVFDSELKVDKDKGFRVDRILDQLMQYIYSYDLNSLRELWGHLDQRMFSKLDQHFCPAVRKLENAVLKMYLVNAVLNGKQEKLTEFFSKMTSELLTQAEWKDWFMLPFIKNPEENPAFTVHFTRQWQDTMLASLHNFLSIIFQCMPQPTLASFGEDAATIKCLQEENEVLRTRLALLLEGGQSSLSGANHPHLAVRSRPVSVADVITPEVPASQELMDDFYVIAQEAPAASESQTKTLKSLIRNIGSNIGGGLPTSPILGRKSIQHTSPQQLQHSGTRKLSSSISLEEKRGKTRAQLTGSLSVSSASSMQGALTGSRLLGSEQNQSGSLKRTSAAGEPKSLENASLKSTPVLQGMMKREPPLETERRERAVSSGRAQHSLAHESPSSEMKVGSAEIICGQESCSYLTLDQEKYLEHKSSVTQCKFNMSGTTIASSDMDGVIKVWSLPPSPKTIATITSKTSVISLEWVNKTERYLLYGTRSGIIRLYDTREKKNVWELGSEATSSLRDTRIVDICCSPTESSFVCSSVPDGSQGKLMLYDIKTRKLERVLPLQSASPSSPVFPVAVTCSAFNHNGQLLVAGCNDGYVRVFDLRRSDCIDSWCAHKSDVLSIQLSNHYTFCYTLGRDGKFCQRSLNQPGHQIWEASLVDPNVVPFVNTGATPLSNGRLFTFDPSGSHMLLCGLSGGIVYQIPSAISQSGNMSAVITPKKQLELGGHRMPVVALDWSGANDCTACVTASCDGHIRISTLLLTQ